MAVNLTKKAKNDLHTVVMEMLSTYDLNNKLVQAFISKMSKDITTKYGPLKETTNKQTDIVSNVNVTDTVNTGRVQQRAAQKPIIPVKPRSAAETIDAKPNTSIFQDLVQSKDSGLVGVIKTLVKKRENDDGKMTSYLGDLKESFKGKSLFDGARNAISTIFKEREANKKEVLKLNNPKANSSTPIIGNNVKPGEQQLNLIKDEMPVQHVVIDDVSQNVLDGIEKTLAKSFSGLTSFKKDLIDNLKKNLSDKTESSSESGGLFGFIKDRIKSWRAGKNLAKQVTKTAGKEVAEVAGKQIIKTAGKEAAKTVGKEAAKTVGKEATEVVGKEAAKVVGKEATEVVGKEAAKVVGKEATEVAGKQVISAATKAGGKEVAEVAGKQVVKAAGKEVAKVGGKTIGKSLLKKIPGVGLIAGLGFGAERALSGDWTGAGLELASGAASTIPGVGTAASLGIDAAIAGRDIYKAVNEPAETSEASVTAPEPPVVQTPVTPIEVPQKWTPIQETPTLPLTAPSTETDVSASILEKIAKNTETTNSQFVGLIQAIYKLAGAIGNNQPVPMTPNIVMNQTQSSDGPSMSQIAATNVDPIRGVRANFANT